ncbi:translation initiation inhibitor YjgF [Acetobacter aceti NRIC 0242]|uniref:Uncharacterized protein n=1 Tax=Acetobacter aceti NBRC 14818 TaxID=887700 RepID=A0AB33IFA8_ACEAC|nr:RidA family protein [Acetobacter aceti]TCS34430.1 enamine deaminase RidA (YjgF/YER057c/UK114 family) [Acetobacter aceti NBRC 14818]BCK76855.1 hypothetical protein EMQ_2461 [Acetobacter aceti NBRC 14818]GAN56295.1 translation initiation inhibitor/endoribonuclease L-PSP [Acetobacter aceti NBRC 14818]GBO79733.1 translation initiation inhibitor YjgF [Acetobacter aceti NRIC 0242]
MTIKRLAPEERLSGASVCGNMVYLAGQVADDATLDAEGQTADDATLDAEGQTADILRQIDALLAEADTSKSNLLSVQIFLADINDMAAMNRAWDAWLDRDNKPARATVEAKLADPSWKVEITGIAVIG